MKIEVSPQLIDFGLPKKLARADKSKGILYYDDTFMLMPTEGTLKRYGLSLIKWVALAIDQHCVCFVCKKLPNSRRLCIDHEHVKGWKKMEPEERAKYVRGLLCWTCNHYYLARGMTVTRATLVADYLRRYEAKRHSTSVV